MKTQKHFQKLYQTFKEDGVLKAIRYDREETSDRGYVMEFAKAIGAGFVMGVVANTLYSGVECLVTGQTFVDAFQNLGVTSKDSFIGGAIGSKMYCSLRREQPFDFNFSARILN